MSLTNAADLALAAKAQSSIKAASAYATRCTEIAMDHAIAELSAKEESANYRKALEAIANSKSRVTAAYLRHLAETALQKGQANVTDARVTLE